MLKLLTSPLRLYLLPVNNNSYKYILFDLITIHHQQSYTTQQEKAWVSTYMYAMHQHFLNLYTKT